MLILKGGDLEKFKNTHMIIARTPLKCEENHPLVLMKKTVERVICNHCRLTFPKRHYFWSCHKCMYDICLDCEKPKECAWDFITDY